MKRFNKLFFILMCCVSTMSLTSCLNDDDNGIDPETYAKYLQQMSGTYYGSETYQNRIYFYNDTISDSNNSNKIDSISSNVVISISARDSSFLISGVPSRVLAKEIDSVKFKGLRDAIEELPNQSIRGKVLIANVMNYGSYLYFYPTSLTLNDLSYDGGTHDVTIAFLIPSAGSWSMSGTFEGIQVPIFVGAFFEDDSEIQRIYDGTMSNPDDYNRSLLDIRAFR